MRTDRVETHQGHQAGSHDARTSRTARARWTGLFLMPRGLALSLLLLLVFSCTSGTGLDRGSVVPSSVLELGASERAEEQRRSLSHAYYRNNPAPPTPSARELRRLERDLERAPNIEVEELRALFGNDLELLAYATRDTDGDGVLDFRISEYRGKFFEGDIDVDGDGIRNVYDAEPYDRLVGGKDTDGDGVPDKAGSFADRDGDGIPDHLDWSRAKGETMAALQTGLFHDFDVMLVERSARYTPELAQAVDDTLRLVFREPIPSLRTIAVEDTLLISPDLGDNGFMLGQTQTLTICVDSLAGAEPIVMLGLVVHEVGHAWQLAQDFDAHDISGENKKMHFPPGQFTHSLTEFGWEVDVDSIGEGYFHRLYWPHFYATSPRYLYRGYAPNEWAAWFEDIQRDAGPDFLRTSPAMLWGMVGPYSLTSPWEWHADQLMASVYNRLDEGIANHRNHTYRNVGPLLSMRMLETVQRQWSRFDYRNAAGTGVDRELAQAFELRPEDVQLLVDRYVVPLVDLPMLAQADPIEPSSSVYGLGAELVAAWTTVRDQVDEPLSRLPRLDTLAHASIEPWRPRERRASDADLRPTKDSAPDPLGGAHGKSPENSENSENPENSENAEPTADLGDAEPSADDSIQPTRRAGLREALEQAADTKLGTRHGAGQVGGVCPAGTSVADTTTIASGPDADLDTSDPLAPIAAMTHTGPSAPELPEAL